MGNLIDHSLSICEGLPEDRIRMAHSLIALRYKGSHGGKKIEYAIEIQHWGSRRMCDPLCVAAVCGCRMGPKMRPLSHFRHVTLKNSSVFYTFEITFLNVFTFWHTFLG